MKPTIGELREEDRYVEIARISFEDPWVFVRHELKRFTLVTALHYALSVGVVALLVLGAISSGLSAWWVAGQALIGLFLGMVISPWLRVVMQKLIYRSIGVPRVDTVINEQKGVMMISAKDFVFERGEVVSISITHFVVLLPVVAAVWWFFPWLRPGSATFLGISLAALIGEVAVLSFYWRNRQAKIYSYDSSVEEAHLFFAEAKG